MISRKINEMQGVQGELIKAEALEELGRDVEAQALRLDSQGWARYGFGSFGAMQAKSAEIAALGARG